MRCHQCALTLAVGEEALEFEHRDLHWGNLLIARQATGAGGADHAGARAGALQEELQVPACLCAPARSGVAAWAPAHLPPPPPPPAPPPLSHSTSPPPNTCPTHSGFRLRGVDVAAPLAGVRMTLIDFTLSRLVLPGGEPAYCNLAADPELFKGPKGDVQVCGGGGEGQGGGGAGGGERVGGEELAPEATSFGTVPPPQTHSTTHTPPPPPRPRPTAA